MLGHYENFPENIHALAFLQNHSPAKSVQQVILSTFYRLNNETFDLGDVTPFLKQKCEVGFEFGVADGFDFSFLDQNELDKCLGVVAESEVEFLDFFFVVRYHLVGDGKRVPLKFDYHVFRCVFLAGELELRVRHERGTQRVPLDDLITFLVRQVNVELSRRELMPLVFVSLEKVGVK